ncbi:MAG: hypothetical protein IJO32_07300 [Bacilli bacterium]|nr:hypothetical protein [Bacilli bacterium]
MKNKNDFVKEKYGYEKISFKQIVKKYYELTNHIERLTTKKEEFDKKIKEDYYDDEELSFREKMEMFNIIDNLAQETYHKTHKFDYLGADLNSLRERLIYCFKDVSDYVHLSDEIYNLKSYCSNLLDDITFYKFGTEKFNEKCMDKHFLVYIDGELKCMNCGATSKDYDLTKEETEFLCKCADRNGLLIGGISKDDLPLIKVLMAEKEKVKEKRTPLDELDENNYMTYVEEYYLQDESEIPDITREIKKAHLLDSKNYNNENIKVSNPKYLSESDLLKLSSILTCQKEIIQKSDTRFKKMLLEQCDCAYFEILMLFGAHIPSLIKEAKNDDEKYAIIKAYCNLSNQTFRVNSGYFKDDNRNWDALAYDCRTANPEINEAVLKLKYNK